MFRIFFYISLINLITGSTLYAKDYHYSVDLGYPEKYPILFSELRLPTTGNIIEELYISRSGGGGGPWGSGSQASSIVESQPFPTKIIIKWFSVSENQFWEVEQPIDQTFFKKMNSYQITSPFRYFRNRAPSNTFMERTFWNIYVVPGGIAFIWITGGNSEETYLLPPIHAKKAEFNWEVFMDRAANYTYDVDYKAPERKTYVQQRLQETAKKTNSPIDTLTNKDADQWLRYINKYNWQLALSSPFELKDQEIRYINEERRILYAQIDQATLSPRPIPSRLDFFMVNKNTNQLSRILLYFGDSYVDETYEENWTEIITAFEKLNQQLPTNTPITLNLEIPGDMSDLKAFLIKGNTKIELKDIRPQIIDNWDDYTPVVCTTDSPDLLMTKDDFSDNPKESRSFRMQDQAKNPIRYFKYRVLRSDGKYYYGITDDNGSTVSVKTVVNGKKLKADLYKDYRDSCLPEDKMPKNLDTYKPVPSQFIKSWYKFSIDK